MKPLRLLFVLAVGCVLPIVSSADTYNDGTYIWTYSVVDGKATLVNDGNTAAVAPAPTGELTIPSELGGCPVVELGSHALYSCSGLTSVTIPEGVTNIGSSVFTSCGNLTSVTIPEGVTSIGYGAFYYTRLTSVTIPSSVTSIGAYAFSNTRLTSVAIPLGVKSIGTYAFNGCSSLTSVTIPEGVASIGAGTFYNCSGLTSVAIPSSVKDIGEYAFYGCRSLESVTISEGVTSLGPYAFYECRKLTSVTIPSSVMRIGRVAFKGCSGLATVTYLGDENLVDIAPKAFQDTPYWQDRPFELIVRDGCARDFCGECPEEVVIPSGVTSIGDDLFSGCNGLLSVKIAEGVTNIGYQAFNNCWGMKSVELPSSLKTVGAYAFYGCSGLTSVTIPSGVTAIGGYAFYNCYRLTSMDIPPSVTSLGAYAFYNCYGLTSVTISSSVTSIGKCTFCKCFNLTSVTIPAGVTSIGVDAFARCSNLKWVLFLGDKSQIDIAQTAFEQTPYSDGWEAPAFVIEDDVLVGLDWRVGHDDGCITNGVLTIPEGIVEIAEGALGGVFDFWKVELPSTLKRIGSYAFEACGCLREVTGGENLERVGYWAFKLTPFLYGVDSLDVFGEEQFEGFGWATLGNFIVGRWGWLNEAWSDEYYDETSGAWTWSYDLVIPEGTTGMADGIFDGLPITSVTIPSSLKTISEGAFYECSLRPDVVIPSSITDIGLSAFGSCSGLTAIQVETGNAFYSSQDGLLYDRDGSTLVCCPGGLTSVTIPSSVKIIGDCAFEGCGFLSNIEIPSSVEHIGEYAFYDCEELKTVYVHSSNLKIVRTAIAESGLDLSEIQIVCVDMSVASVGSFVRYDLVEDLGVMIPSDVDYAKGDKVRVKVEGLAKGLKLVKTPVYVDPTAKKKVIKDYVYTIEGVPTEAIDFATRPMYARVSVTYKDKTKGEKGKAESLQPVALAIVPQEPHVLTEGVLNEAYEPVDIAALWPEVADAKENPKEWSFKGWPSGVKYTTKAVTKKNKDKSVTTNAVAYSVYGTPTKAGEFPITATHKYKIGKTTVSETFSAVLTVWGNDGVADFRYTDQAYVATETKTLDATFKSFSGLPTGVKWTAKAVAANAKKGTPAYPAYSLYGTPTKAGVFAVTATKVDKTKETFLWKVTPGENDGFLGTMNWPVADSAVTVMAGVIQTNWTCSLPTDAKVTASGLPSGLKLVQDKTTKAWTLAGTPTKAGNYVVSLKTVRNGVTVNERISIIVEPNEWTGNWYGVQADFGHKDTLKAEVTVKANGMVKLVLTEASTNYNAKGVVQSAVRKTTVTVKNLDANGTTATLTLPKNKKDPSSEDRVCVLDFEEAALTVDGELRMFLAEADGEAPWPDVTTVVLEETAGGETNAYGYVTATYNAKKGSFALAGKLWDGTSVKGTCSALADGVISPVLVTDKAKNAVSITLGSVDGDLLVFVRENGELVPVGRKLPNGYEPWSGSFAAAELKSKKFNTMSVATQLVVLTDAGETGLPLAEKDRKASVSAQGLVKFTVTDAGGWKWVCELLPIDNGGVRQFRGIATGTKKGETTQVCPVRAE